jgi:hypothetical protein
MIVFCKDVCDAAAIADAKIKLFEVASDVTGIKIMSTCKEIMVPDDVWNDPKDCPLAMLYGICILHLVPVGATPGLFAHMDDKQHYQWSLDDFFPVIFFLFLIRSTHMVTQPLMSAVTLLGNMFFFYFESRYIETF